MYTALRLAAREGHTEVVTMLVKAGAEVNRQDSQVLRTFRWLSYFVYAVMLLSTAC
jgi:ethanolamine utilization cobalamin adenosyltransferase